MNQHSLSIGIGTVYLIEPQIIRMKINEGETFDVEHVYAGRKANLTLNEGKPFCILLDTGSFFNTTPQARALTAGKEFSKHRIAIAGLAPSLPTKMVGNFFINFHKPTTPTRLFTNENEAISWLRQMLKEYNTVTENNAIGQLSV